MNQNNSQKRTFKFYHGTSVEAAKDISVHGFKESTSGKLGRGVYIGRKDLASGYAKGAMVEVLITVYNPKFQSQNYGWNDDKWRKLGHDACRIDLGDSPEWIVANPNQIQVLRWYTY